MSVDWTQFTPFTSLAGGVAIGLAAALYVLGLGRIAGITGVVGSALQSLRTRPSGAALAWLFSSGAPPA